MLMQRNLTFGVLCSFFYILCKVPSAPLWRIGRALSMEEGCQIIAESMTVDYSE
jgi:hypothetical protein